MKQLTFSVHPGSALIGAAIVGLSIVTAGAITVQGSGASRDVSAIENVNDVHPREFVCVKGLVPFVVPPDKLLVLTALGSANNTIIPWTLQIDGTIEVGIDTDSSSPHLPTILEFARPGLVAYPGQNVTVLYPPNPTIPDGRAWGYLVDA